MARVFIGSEALAAGALTRSSLRWNYRRIFPDVYAPVSLALTLRDRTIGAWLWSRRRAVIAGSAAAALHGADWVGREVPVELIWRCGRPPPGVIVRNERLAAGDVVDTLGMPVTTAARTAFDLARHLARDDAVPRLDALARAQEVPLAAALAVAEQHRGGRGVANAVENLRLMDGGARTVHESQLRLCLLKRWSEPPSTQIQVVGGSTEMVLGVGYVAPKVGLDFEGKRADDVYERGPLGYVRAPWLTERTSFYEAEGWRYIYVIREDNVGSVWSRVGQAFEERGYRPPSGAW